MALNLIWSPGAPPSWCSLARRCAFGDHVWEPRPKPQLSKKSEDAACLETTFQDVSPRDFPTRDLGPRRFGDHTWGCPNRSAWKADVMGEGVSWTAVLKAGKAIMAAEGNKATVEIFQQSARMSKACHSNPEKEMPSF